MWFVPMLLVCALPVQGELKLTLEQAAYPADDTATVLEVSYEIPNTSLAFLREDSGFVARYQVSIQVSDKQRDVVAGDLWEKVVRYREYASTVARDSVTSGTVTLVVPRAALDARVEVNDLASERSALARFRIERPSGGLDVRLYRSGEPVAIRKYGIGDTLVAVAEAANGVGTEDSLHPGAVAFRLDSCRFVLKRERRVVAGATVPATMDQGRATRVLQSRFEYPIGDSAGVTRLGGGEYSLEVTGFGPGKTLHATAGFRVAVPFFLDDSMYLSRVGQLVYVATTEELRHLRSAPQGEREQAWREFWKKKEQSPIKGRYVTEAEYFERIDYAQEHFGHGDRGYLSDRGHVYVIYGAPDQVESRPFDIDTPAAEVWYYYQINKEFDFVDRFGAGQYSLQNREEL
jgi:GWxTD domain-containing protein